MLRMPEGHFRRKLLCLCSARWKTHGFPAGPQVSFTSPRSPCDLQGQRRTLILFLILFFPFHARSPQPVLPCIYRLCKETPALSTRPRWAWWPQSHLDRFSWCHRWCCQPGRGQWHSEDSTLLLRWPCTRSSASGTAGASSPPLLPEKIQTNASDHSGWSHTHLLE